jgi:outer membrane beta-barrel protein
MHTLSLSQRRASSTLEKSMPLPSTVSSLAAIACLAACLGLAPTASAQDVHVTGPLAGAPAVRHMREYREGHVNLIPGIGYTLQDEYARSLMVTLEANYHFLEWLGIGVWGGFNVAPIDTDLTNQIHRFGQTAERNRLSLPECAAGDAACRGPNGEFVNAFNSQVGRVVWAASLHLMFVPLRGKLSLFQAVFIDTDLYIFGGVALFGITERAATSVTAADCGGLSTSATCAASATARADRVAVTPMFGVGMSFYANSWFGVMLEWRAFPFAWNNSGTDESGEGRDRMPGSGFPDGVIDGTDSRTTFNQMINIGLIFNLPPDVAVGD